MFFLYRDNEIKMETTLEGLGFGIILGSYTYVHIYIYMYMLGIYWDNGKEHGNY